MRRANHRSTNRRGCSLAAIRRNGHGTVRRGHPAPRRAADGTRPKDGRDCTDAEGGLSGTIVNTNLQDKRTKLGIRD